MWRSASGKELPSADASSRSCGWRRRSSCSPATISPCATGPSSRRWPGPLCWILMPRGEAFRQQERQPWLERVAASLRRRRRVRGGVRRSRQRGSTASRAFVKTAFQQAGHRRGRRTARFVKARWSPRATSWSTRRRGRPPRQRAAQLIDDVHREHPERQGLSLTDLRNTITKEFPIDDLFDSLVAGLCEQGFARAGSIIQRASHRAQLPEPLRAAGETLRRALSAQPLEPPSRKELTPDASSQRALQVPDRKRRGHRDQHRARLERRRRGAGDAQVKAFIAKQGPATVSELRQSLGSSRRVVVPLLEYLDRTFVTVRHGDKRALR